MKTTLFVRQRLCTFLFLFLLTVPFTLFAGSGSITPAPANGSGIRGLMNFTVNFRYVPSAADVTAMEDAIRVANDAICDATDGQIVFGTVTITSGSVNEDQADVWVLAEPGRSSVSFWTDGSGFGRDGAHVNLFSSGIDGRVIAHELGHLAFGIGDEYDEQCRWGGPCGIGPCFDPGTTDDRNNTLMANQNTMSELSVPANHDPIVGDGSGCPGVETCPGMGLCTGDSCDGFNGGTGRYEASQNTLMNGGLSDWEVLERNYMALGLTIPALPVAAVPTFCDAFLNIDTQVEGSSLVVLTFDRSGSMAIQDVGDRTRLEFAQAAGRAFVDLQRNKDIDLGIVEFSSSASTVRAVEDLTSANSTSFKNDIDGLTASGNTAIGDGLIEARVQLQIAQAVAAANGETLTNPTVFLLSDGQNNTGADPDAVADNLIDAGITIHSIPVGNGADTELLSDLASESGGVMLPAYTDDMIPAIYAELAARHQGYSLINGQVGFDEHIFFEFPLPSMFVKLPVERGADVLTIFLGLKNVDDRNLESDNIRKSVDLIDPRGEKIPVSRFTTSEDAFYRIIQVRNPMPGEYTLFVNNTQLVSPDVNVVSFVENPMPDFYIDAIPRLLSVPDSILISGAVSFGTSLYDPKISYRGIVIRPDSSLVPIDLELDPITGAVSAYFDDFNGGGTYKVVAEANVPGGASTLPGESIFDTPSEYQVNVERFIRVASTSFTLFRPGECPPCAEDDKDCDDDGIPNEVEDSWPNQDVDGDGLPNRCDEDSDGDDIPDKNERDLDLNQNNIPDVYERPEDRCDEDSEFKIVDVRVEHPDCDQRNGKIAIRISGARGAVKYKWSHDARLNAPVANNLPAFIYSVTAIDEAGCRRTATINLKENCYNVEEPDDFPVSVRCSERVSQGCEFPVLVTVDLAGAIAPDDLLGSFTGMLRWDPTLVEHVGPSDLLSGFNGFINLDAANGKLLFNGANSGGAGGIVDLFKTRFRAIGPVGTISAVKVDFISFAAANTFKDMTPKLVYDQCVFEIIPSGKLGDVNGDGLVTSTDGNIILSYDVGLPLPPAIQERIDNGFGDVNQDGVTDATDALIVLTYDVQLPVPYPVGEAFCPSSAGRHLGVELRSDESIDVLYSIQEVPDHPKQIAVPVHTDLSELGEKLGSYKAVVSWNPAELSLVQHFGGSTAGLEMPTVNTSEIEEGKLTLAHANPMGVSGKVNLFNLQFEELTNKGTGSLDIRFEKVSSANTFRSFRAEVKSEQEMSNALLSAPAVNIFPNPFTENVQIVYELPEEAHVQIAVYNAFGQQIATLLDDRQIKGTHRITWNGPTTQHAGLYTFMVKVGSTVTSKRVVYMRKD